MDTHQLTHTYTGRERSRHKLADKYAQRCGENKRVKAEIYLFKEQTNIYVHLH